MERYDMQKYLSFLVKGNLHEAINYLEAFPGHDKILKEYNDIFKHNKEVTRTNNKVINELDKIYQNYYKDVFWFKENHVIAETELFKNLWKFCGCDESIEKNSYIETEVEKIVRSEGYDFLGGNTAGYYGPYIWKGSKREVYDVELPSGIEKYSVIMMDGFITKSWLDFLSLGKAGTGGWIREDGTLCCISSMYDTMSPEFNISFLKHEAQHDYDIRMFPQIMSEELEYRAKLVELVYWKDEEVLKKIYFEADNSDAKNTHSIASHRIISNLSEKLFEVNYEVNITRFVEKLDNVKEIAKELLYEDTIRLSQ